MALKPKELSEATDISSSYASMILSGDRTPSPTLAATIWLKTGHKFGLFAGLSDEDAETMARIHTAKVA